MYPFGRDGVGVDDAGAPVAEGEPVIQADAEADQDLVVDPGVEHTLKEGKFGLANVAPTVATLLGLTPPACWEESML